jgi:hypothetical protein
MEHAEPDETYIPAAHELAQDENPKGVDESVTVYNQQT